MLTLADINGLISDSKEKYDKYLESTARREDELAAQYFDSSIETAYYLSNETNIINPYNESRYINLNQVFNTNRKALN